MRSEQLAINSVSTRQADLQTSLDAYQQAGFVNVEFWLSHVWQYLEQGGTRAALQRLLGRYNLQCIGGFETPLLCFAGTQERRTNHDRILENAELLAELGGRNLVVGTDGPETEMADPLSPVVEAFSQVGERIASTGVTLCLEFNWSPLVKSLRTAGHIARCVGRDNVGVLFDPAHYHCTPSKFDQLDDDNGPWIKHVHVDDMRDKPAELSNCNSDRLLPGQGCLDLPALFGRIEDYGYRGYFSIEMFSDELWALPAERAAGLMYASLAYLCTDRESAPSA